MKNWRLYAVFFICIYQPAIEVFTEFISMLLFELFNHLEIFFCTIEQMWTKYESKWILQNKLKLKQFVHLSNVDFSSLMENCSDLLNNRDEKKREEFSIFWSGNPFFVHFRICIFFNVILFRYPRIEVTCTLLFYVWIFYIVHSFNSILYT